MKTTIAERFIKAQKRQKPFNIRDLAMREHLAYIKKEFGEKRADTANIGWAEDDDCIVSKVYGTSKEPTVVVSTSYDSQDKTGESITHYEEDY